MAVLAWQALVTTGIHVILTRKHDKQYLALKDRAVGFPKRWALTVLK
jgi:hypothetical protein